MNELILARALFTKAVLLVGLVILVLIGVQLKWVLVQVFAAGILAAGVQPIVAALTQPERGAARRWRPPFVATVVLVYVCLCLVVIVLGSILLGAVVIQTTTLLQRVPEYAARVQEWHADLVGRWSLLRRSTSGTCWVARVR
jgi:predicted PurR-regulated permease PerM